MNRSLPSGVSSGCPPAESTGDTGFPAATEPEVSVVIPCLNEADTLEACVRKAREALQAKSILGEIIVADNGSTDGSRALAVHLGARLVSVEARGYGHALMGGIAAARGRYVIMGDADDSYDFGELPKFVEKLRQGFDLVQGCRLASGGGAVSPGAMPFLHRWVGNPLLSLLVRKMFWSPVHDVYCGMRGFSRKWYDQLDQRCTGMEFATEMIIKSALFKARTAQVPITLHRDGRKSHPPHLRTFRDGWRTLRLFLIYSPRWLFVYPGLAFICMGLLGYAIALPGAVIGGLHFDVHTLLVASLAILVGSQTVLFGVFAKTFGVREGLLPADPRLTRLLQPRRLEQGLVAGMVLGALGLALLLNAVNQWRVSGFGSLDYPTTMRWVIPGVTLIALGCQTVFSSFMIGLLGMQRR